MKLIDGYPNYYIYEDGKVWNDRRKNFLKPMINKGYHQIILCKHSKHKTFKVHKLVAIAYIPNTNNRIEINHINGIKTDNRIENLEWCTRSENNFHKFRVLKQKCSEKMIAQSRLNGLSNRGVSQKRQIILNTETGIYYFNAIEAAETVGNLNPDIIRRHVRGAVKNKTSFIRT